MTALIQNPLPAESPKRKRKIHVRNTQYFTFTHLLEFAEMLQLKKPLAVIDIEATGTNV